MLIMNVFCKILRILFYIFFLFVNNYVYAQKKNVLKLNCTDFVINRYSMGFERLLGNYFALAIDLDLIKQFKFSSL